MKYRTRYIPDYTQAVGVFLVVILGFVVLGFALRRRPTQMPGQCVARYRLARTYSDTLVVDQVVFGARETSPLSCGNYRKLQRQRSNP